MIYSLSEGVRRSVQMLFGCRLFDFSLFIGVRNITLKLLFGKVGKKNVISSHTLFYVPHGAKISSVKIGSKVRISENVRIDCISPVTIGDNVWISEDVHIENHEHIINGREWKETKNIRTTDGISIGDDAWIGAGAMILPKVSYIGKGAIIGAGSIVTKNVEDYTIVAGNPAKVIGNR